MKALTEVGIQFEALTFSTSHSSVIKMPTAEVNSIQATIPAVNKSALSSIAQKVIKVDGSSSLAKEGIEVSTCTCTPK